MPERYPVVVVGGGPVGMALAIDLGTRGVRCMVVERHETPQHIPKGQNLTQRTMESLDFWGVEPEIRAARVMPPGYPNSGVTAYRNLMSDYSYPWWRRSAVAQFYARENERIPQYETERILRGRAQGLPEVEAMLGWTAVSIEEGHRVRLANRSSGDERIVEGDFVVGCDGSHSTVRDAAGFRQHLSDHDRKMVLLVFRSAHLARELERFGEVSFFNIMDPELNGYWKFLGRVDASGHFFFHAPVPAEATTENQDFTGLLQDAVGVEFTPEFDYIGFWDLRFAIAESYRGGPVLLAGDAAHSHPPYGGYGINTGFEDARNLGWKLAAVLGGWGGESLLDTYDMERRPVFESTASDFIEKMIHTGRSFLSRHDPDVDRDDFEAAWRERQNRSMAGVSDFEPHYEGSPVVDAPGSPSALGSHVFQARPGHHLPPRGGVFERLGRDFTLLAFDIDPGPFVTAASKLSLPLDVVASPHSGEVTDYGARLVLVRPDHFVSWVGDDVDAFSAEAAVALSMG